MTAVWTTFVSGSAFRSWAESVASSSRVRQGQRLDPFVQSMRNLQPVGGWLARIRTGEPLEPRGGAETQNYTDLKSAGLIEGDDIGSMTLTELGEAVCTRWTKADIVDDLADHELLRCIVLVEEAFRLGVEDYMRMVEFWSEIRSVFDAKQVLNSSEHLFLFSYLNQDIDGYNPWLVLRSAVSELSSDPTEWQELIDALPDRTDITDTAVDRLQTRVKDWATRGRPRQTFCAAMELVALSRESTDDAIALLEDLKT